MSCSLYLTLTLSALFLVSYPMRRTLCNRWQDFTHQGKLRVFVGTWNVNGGRHMRSVALKNQSMHEWLLDAPATSGKTTRAVSKTAKHYMIVIIILYTSSFSQPEMFESPNDIYAIGFQELVGLTAANLVSTRQVHLSLTLSLSLSFLLLCLSLSLSLSLLFCF